MRSLYEFSVSLYWDARNRLAKRQHRWDTEEEAETNSGTKWRWVILGLASLDPDISVFHSMAICGISVTQLSSSSSLNADLCWGYRDSDSPLSSRLYFVGQSYPHQYVISSSTFHCAIANNRISQQKDCHRAAVEHHLRPTVHTANGWYGLPSVVPRWVSDMQHTAIRYECVPDLVIMWRHESPTSGQNSHCIWTSQSHAAIADTCADRFAKDRMGVETWTTNNVRFSNDCALLLLCVL